MIILYDIPTSVSESRDWSPNVWKIRLVLNYKGLPHKTQWVDYPDIHDLCQARGIPPGGRKPDGSSFHTVPIIYDSKTLCYVSDSLQVAQYLESMYPNRSLFPVGLNAAILSFEDLWLDKVLRHLFPLMILPVYLKLPPASQKYFRTTRELRYKKKLEDLAPLQEHPRLWDQVRRGLDSMSRPMDANGKEKLFWFGNKITYADVVMVAWLLWVKRTLGTETSEWRNILSWNNGRWGKLMRHFEQWEFVDNPSRL
ncbi:hypothetical protein J3R30DRAFT_816765 [Lentinula aciculospora]|uniref:GST N-terminal domain-containing protein n=1 Tax=Lentinula aciculospora TaxID=153920 RepID=A0A9W9DW14_9AGAR|nr:hypothetical protein J3R30DRAFT_816765 [Lentinula aciculospora]